MEPTLDLAIKVYCGEEIRRFSFILDRTRWDHLCQDICKTFEITNPQSLVVRYRDEEGDFITISSDEEIREAIKLLGKDDKILRLYILKKDTTPKGCDNWRVKRDDRKFEKILEKQKQKEDRWSQKRQRYHEKLKKRDEREWKKELKVQMKDQKKRLVARFVRHVSIPDGTEFMPNTSFTKIWRFRNEGTTDWPDDCFLTFVSKREGDLMGASENIFLHHSVKAGDEIEIAVDMISPAKTGQYFGYWRLCTPLGRKFGQRVWVKINVVAPPSPSLPSGGTSGSVEQEAHSEPTLTIAEQLKMLKELGFRGDVARQIELLRKHNGNVPSVIAELLNSPKSESP